MSAAISPPPLPSDKRILPALLLGALIGFLGVHRFYVGRFISGAILLAASLASFYWLQNSCAGLMQLTTIDEVQAWADTHGSALGPLTLFAAIGLVPMVDCIRLAAGKFRDGKGAAITRWM